MAQIVLGLGTCHGPMLSIPAVNWSDRAKFDRANKEMYFQGKVYNFEQLAELRRAENLLSQCEFEEQQRRHARCQAAIRQVGDRYEAAAADVTVILGNDQMEVFKAEHVPAFAIYWGAFVEGIPRTPEFLAKLPPGIPQAELDRTPAVYTQYPTSPELGKHLIEGTMRAGFDVAQLTKLPTGEIGSNAVPHAYGFVYRRILRDKLCTSVPVFINTFYPPNQPTARRCWEFGCALGNAILAWPGNQRVAVIASGGLSHFVVDEALDHKILAALKSNDIDALCSVPESEYQSGTSEWKNWFAAAGLMSVTGKTMRVVDYVPCYRSEAGTGSGLGFAVWD
jgi:hypothetical protein